MWKCESEVSSPPINTSTQFVNHGLQILVILVLQLNQ